MRKKSENVNYDKRENISENVVTERKTVQVICLAGSPRKGWKLFESFTKDIGWQLLIMDDRLARGLQE